MPFLGFQETSWRTRGDEVSWALLIPPLQPNPPQTHKYLSINYILHYVSGFKSEPPRLPRPSRLPYLPILKWEGEDPLAHKCHSHALCFLQGSPELWHGPWSTWTAASQLYVGTPTLSSSHSVFRCRHKVSRMIYCYKRRKKRCMSQHYSLKAR